VAVCAECSLESSEQSGRFCPQCGAAFLLSSATQQLVGQTLDRQFVIESIIGGGSFGTVYRARQLGIDRPVALKIPTHDIASDGVMVERFAREARSTARIQHPGVVAIYAVGELADGRPYLAMEYIEGRPLTDILKTGPVRAPRALGIARQIASALSETHAAGVIHRDLKPSNIMWRRDRNGDDRITLVDFGIAVAKPTMASGGDAPGLTAGGLIGTPHYMAPEQAQGELVDARTDLYALGCVLFELLTGTTPFDGSGFEVLLAHLGKSIPPPSERAEPLKILVPPAADRLVVSLLQKRRELRPATADEVVAKIDDALDEIDDGLGAHSLKGARARRPTNKPPQPRGQPLPRSPSPAAPAKAAAPRRAPHETTVPTTTAELIAASGGGPRRRAALLALGAVAILGAGGFAAFKLTRHAEHELEGKTRTLSIDEGELNLIAIVPQTIATGADTEFHLALHNKLGQPVDSDAALVLVDPAGHEQGYAATPQGEPGHYHFHHTFKDAGHYTLRVFTSPPDTRFDLDLSVE
jgi:serine/threonine-protein kinase